MKNSVKWPSSWDHWLSFSAFTLAGVAFEGAHFGSVVSPVMAVPEARKWRVAEEIDAKGKAGAQR